MPDEAAMHEDTMHSEVPYSEFGTSNHTSNAPSLWAIIVKGVHIMTLILVGIGSLIALGYAGQVGGPLRLLQALCSTRCVINVVNYIV